MKHFLLFVIKQSYLLLFVFSSGSICLGSEPGDTITKAGIQQLEYYEQQFFQRRGSDIQLALSYVDSIILFSRDK
ncbi:MAG: hypothetical protein AAF985_20670, partial [Bacteroidota bacterium]